jgi:hypothetical protein
VNFEKVPEIAQERDQLRADVARLEAERDEARAVIGAVLALHSPRPGWERNWKDPDEALREGWPECGGCHMPGIGYREIGNCPTRKALAAVGQMTSEGSP